MSEYLRSKMLEVIVERRDAAVWEWRVHLGSHILNSGTELTYPAARFAGNDALFRILISAPGWDE